MLQARHRKHSTAKNQGTEQEARHRKHGTESTARQKNHGTEHIGSTAHQRKRGMEQEARHNNKQEFWCETEEGKKHLTAS